MQTGPRLRDLSDLADMRDVDAQTPVAGLALDSRKVAAGDLFAALPGVEVDGARFIDAALARGAAAILCTPQAARDLPPTVPRLTTHEPRRVLARIAARIVPGRPDAIVAVTGTNGKTSVASFAAQLWNAVGVPAATIGTLGITLADGTRKPSLTTPDAITLHQALADLDRVGVQALALEASSHGLAQYRLDGLNLVAAAFTNLSRDHLDYHGTVEAYLAAKLRIFDLVGEGGTAILDIDWNGHEKVLRHLSDRGMEPWTIGRRGKTVRIGSRDIEGAGQRIGGEAFGRPFEVLLPLPGDFQISNALAAAALVVASGHDPSRVMAALETLQGVPGRLERVGGTGSGAVVFVDYAHTPDALSRALATLRPHARGRLIAIAGAGGDRDAGKREPMGRALEEGADIAIITDDNPRSEDPAAIRAGIMRGAPSAVEIGDRAEAIARGIGLLEEGDVLLIAGKGHETGQTIGEIVHPFSDQAVARTVLGASRDV